MTTYGGVVGHVDDLDILLLELLLLAVFELAHEPYDSAVMRDVAVTLTDGAVLLVGDDDLGVLTVVPVHVVLATPVFGEGAGVDGYIAKQDVGENERAYLFDLGGTRRGCASGRACWC